MENENKNIEQTVQGWKDVQINEQMPLVVLINFINVLNQRLASVEDNLFIKTDDGKMISLTELYALQSKLDAEPEVEEVNESEAN